jgi:hypothetical protein
VSLAYGCAVMEICSYVDVDEAGDLLNSAALGRDTSYWHTVRVVIDSKIKATPLNGCSTA